MKISNRYLILLTAAIILTALIAGCGKKAEIEPPKPQMGVLNMAKAIKAHPQYAEFDKLQRQRDSLLAQLSQQQQQAIAAQQQAGIDLSNLAKSIEQEFQTKMAGKQAELGRRLQVLADTLRDQMNEQVDKYVRELDEFYQDRNFALQVKLKTLELSKEEQAAIQQQMEEIQSERMDKIVARQQLLTNQVNEQLKQAEQAAAKELEEYARQLKQQLDSDFAVKSQTMQTSSGATMSLKAAYDSTESQLAQIEHEIAKLQLTIVNDIKKRASDVATAKGLTTVLADVEIFTNLALDITADVVAGSK